MGIPMMKQTSLDKVNGKLVKYKPGDCLSIRCENGRFLAAFISLKFNKYYDIVLMDYYCEEPVEMKNIREGNFFGTRFGSLEEITYAGHIEMMTCNYIDSSRKIEKIGSVVLIDSLIKDGQSFKDNTDELLAFYLQELPIRIEKTANAARVPEIGFVSKHLIEMKHVIVEEKGINI